MTSDSNLEISIEQAGQDFVMLLTGRINVYSSPDLRDSLRAILSTNPLPRTLTVDLAAVPYIETSGIATLVEALRIARSNQIRFYLRGLEGPVRRLFEVTGVHTLFEPSRGEQAS